MICSKCKDDKHLDNFYKNKASKTGYENWCKTCKKNYGSKKRNKENFNEWHRNRRKVHLDYEKEFRIKYLTSLNGTASKLLSSAKNRAKKKRMEFAIDLEWVKEKIVPMKCEVTGTDLTLAKDEKYGCKAPFRPSLDRIDSSKGYTKENTRITCWMYNVCKSHWSDNDVYLMTKNLMSNARNESE